MAVCNSRLSGPVPREALGMFFDLIDALEQPVEIFSRVSGKDINRCVSQKEKIGTDLAEHRFHESLGPDSMVLPSPTC